MRAQFPLVGIHVAVLLASAALPDVCADATHVEPPVPMIRDLRMAPCQSLANDVILEMPVEGGPAARRQDSFQAS